MRGKPQGVHDVIPRDRWRHVGQGVVIQMPCHEICVFASWVMPGGKVTGRIQCSESGCRKVYEGIVLEGWDA